MTVNVGLSTSLRTLVSALNTTQTALNFASENIANVNTDGYTRRIVAQETLFSSGAPVGVAVTEIRRSIDDFLLRSVRAQLSNLGFSSVKNTYYDRLQQFTYGDPDSSGTINNAMNSFYSKLESFSADPSSAVRRSLTISSAQDFANSLETLATGIQNERLNSDIELSSTIDELNNLLNNLADINKAIRESSSVGGDTISLYDARDKDLNELKEIIDADFAFDQFGQVSVSISSTELLGFSQQYAIEYSRASSVDNFINNSPLGAITITALDKNGEETTNVQTLLSASNDTTQVDNIPNGKLRALIDIRDTELPNLLAQLDVFAYTFANEFNELHNSGTGFPPAETLTGDTAYSLSDVRSFTGQTRLTLFDENGNPVLGKFGEMMIPQVIDFDRFDGGDGFGTASVQSIINEINSYYGTQPSSIANLGPANDIRLAAVSDDVTSTEATGFINFSGQPSNNDTLVINGTTITFVTGVPGANQVQIGSDLNTTLINLVTALNASGDANIEDATYSTTTTRLNIEYDLSGTTGNGFTLDDSGTSVATASGATLTGGANASGTFTFDFDFSNLAPDGNPITFDVTQISVNGGGASPVTFDTYTQEAGDRFRTNTEDGTNDTLGVSLTGLGLEEGDTFTITATIVVVDGDNITHTEDVTFTVTVPDPDDQITNTRYAATAVSTGDGELITSSSTNGFLTASLVDANGNPITDDTTPGYLKIDTTNSNYRFSIDQLDSQELGEFGPGSDDDSATNYGFSHFFGLNNFFTFGGSQTNAALNLSVRSDIIDNPALLSSGKPKQSVTTGTDVVYTYEVGAGSNESILDMLELQDTNIVFAATGGLPQLTTDANSFATEIYNYAAVLANNAESEANKNTVLNDALNTRLDEITGVNIDEELAATIQIQSTYSAAAKVLGIVRELFTKIEEVLS